MSHGAQEHIEGEMTTVDTEQLMTPARALIRAMLDVLGAHEVLRVVNAASAYHCGQRERGALDQLAAYLERKLR